MEKKYVLALDQGTTSSRSILFNHLGKLVASRSLEFRQIYPRPGWVEHDPLEIWTTQIETARQVMRQAGVKAEEIAGIGITNQRETTIVWEKDTGRPVCNAIVWQCRRTADICRDFAGENEAVRHRTGLLMDAYFSGTKVKWILDQIPEARNRAAAGDLLFGTVDAWLVYNLTGKRIHATDCSNASRTLLFNIFEKRWDPYLLDLFGIPPAMLPQVRSSSEIYGITLPDLLGGEIPISGMAGDQQASLFGQSCFEKGTGKNTYGTGCFLLMNIGETPVLSHNGLVTTIAWEVGGRLEYALEGSVFIGGAVVQWLRDGLKIIERAQESETLALSVEDNGGVYFVPAFVGLGAPYWDMDARGTIIGLTRGSSRGHIARAALESIAYQTRDVLGCMERDSGLQFQRLKVDGGATANSFLMQFQADILGFPVVCSGLAETTALGAAYLAGLAVGFWKTQGEIADQWTSGQVFYPKMDPTSRERVYRQWQRAIDRSRKWQTE
jgi:glycerol kinase